MELKQRIIGIVVLLALGVILVPLLFDSEVVMPLPAHIRSSVAANTVPEAKIAPQKVAVAHQAQTIKPAAIQTSANKLLDETQEYPDGEVKAEENEAQDLNTASEDQDPKLDSQSSEVATEAKADENFPEATSGERDDAKLAHLEKTTGDKEIPKAVHLQDSASEKGSPKLAHLNDAVTENAMSKLARLKETAPKKEPVNLAQLKKISDDKVLDNKNSLKDALLKKEMANLASVKEAPVKRESFTLVSHSELPVDKVTSKETHHKDSSMEREHARPVRLGEASAQKEMEEMIRLEHQQLQKTESITSSGTWTVQLGIFSEQANAKKLVAQLQAKGFNAFTERSDAQKNLHRVLVGPMADRISANQIVTRLQKQLNMKGIIVRSRG